MADLTIIGQNNRFSDGIPVATDTDPDPDYDVRNVNDLRLYTRWRGASAGQKYIYVDAGAVKAFNALGIRGHNLGTAAAGITLETSNGFSLSDSFDNGALDAVNFGTALAGAGSVVETVQLDLSASGINDGAMVYDKNLLGPRQLSWSGIIKSECAPVAGDLLLMAQWQDAAPPAVVATSLSAQSKIKAAIYQSTGGFLRFTYRGIDGSLNYWDGSAWTLDLNDVAYAGAINTVYISKLINDGVNLTFQIWNSIETVMHAEAVILMEAVEDDVLDEYLTWGDFTSVGPRGTMACYQYDRTDDTLGAWATVLATFTPDSDGIIFKRFPEDSSQLVRVGFNTALIPAELGILILGTQLVMPYSQDRPNILLDEGVDALSQDDDSNELLGTTVKHRSRKYNYSISTLDRDFVFGELYEFWQNHAMDRLPFMIAPFPEEFPDYVWWMRLGKGARFQTPLSFFDWVDKQGFNLVGPLEANPTAKDVP